MSKSVLTEPVFKAKIGKLHSAKDFLSSHGITSRHSSPKKAEGYLRVSPRQAENARKLLAEWSGSDEQLISRETAKSFFCPRCDDTLSLGAVYCPECGEFVGDAHMI